MLIVPRVHDERTVFEVDFHLLVMGGQDLGMIFSSACDGRTVFGADNYMCSCREVSIWADFHEFLMEGQSLSCIFACVYERALLSVINICKSP